MAEETTIQSTETTQTEPTGSETEKTVTTAESKAEKTENQMSTEALEKLIQSRVDKATAKFGKEKAELQKQLSEAKKANLTAEELQKVELADREKSLAEKERELNERESRLYAIKAIKKAELDDGSNLSLELVDFVIGKDEAETDARVKSFKTLVDKFVTAKVNATFKQNGRVPNGSGKETTESKDTSLAEKLGKKRAETAKKSDEILKYYYGGKK